MERVNRILSHPAYRRAVQNNREAERERRFCRHDMAHFLDVARIAMLLNLKEGLGIEEELIYAAALVHDMGRYVQYKRGTPHESASAELARPILTECGFEDKETDVIIEAVRSHRNAGAAAGRDLAGILYRADKLSRACFSCPVQQECDWDDEKKNTKLRI